MGLRHPITAALCAVAVIANPLMAAWQPCCCTQHQVGQQVTPAVASTGKSCCAKPQTPVQQARLAMARDCGCAVKAAVPPLTIRTTLLKPTPPIDWSHWVARPLVPVVATFGDSRLDVRALPDVGPALLAVLCRWLK